MASFLEQVSDAASKRSKKEGDKKRAKDKKENKGMNFQQRLKQLLD